MGFLVAFNRKMYLTNYINTLQSKLTALTEEKLKLTDYIASTTTSIKDLDSNSDEVKQIQAMKARLEARDKEMDYEIQKMQTQLQAAQTELQSSDQMLQQEIGKSFSISYGGR